MCVRQEGGVRSRGGTEVEQGKDYCKILGMCTVGFIVVGC